ncbi:sigma 54-interacting transcriptional regulator [Thiocapsa marina]|uniref:Putative two component, sigma54 specific, transcriptional regulator n=1 Tax=Thiocapsa marina 5811 TaxID=768671 RepID=F9UI48_9GAMM|nr:sigma 54-interacting transcriptional regulator [Thiocapsa marina]EGV16107.1 putative two component, sigma54 specific, transcriptional regulator [Thiocapsa marina 5811]
MIDPFRILLVDDDAGLLRLLSIRLRAAGHVIEAASSGEQAIALLPHFMPSLVITDLRMGGLDGLALFSSVQQDYPGLPVIILTAHGSIPEAVKATQQGVFGYLTKPFDGQELLAVIGRAQRVSTGADSVSRRSDGADEWRDGILTRSAAMEEVLRQAYLAAGTDTNILIQGESGTGKELLARAIHRASHRANRPFVAVNCTAIPETLLESELFGHSKGSFTGATQNRKGLFEEADAGTLFLDEIGDMPLAFQAKLLRALQEGEVRPVGANRSVPVDVRIVSATHRDLDQALIEERFRNDLFYRLDVVRLAFPPLRERCEDVSLLASHFLARANGRNKRHIEGFAPDAMELMMSAPWPGNVRQLQNLVEQAAALCTTEIIPASLVQRALRNDLNSVPSLADARERFDREYLENLLRITEGNVASAARLAGRNRTELYKLLRRHRLEPALFRNSQSDAKQLLPVGRN